MLTLVLIATAVLVGVGLFVWLQDRSPGGGHPPAEAQTNLFELVAIEEPENARCRVASEERRPARRSNTLWAETTSPHGRLMLTVLGGLVEFEREADASPHR